VSVRAGRVFVADASGNVVNVLDARTGALVTTALVRKDPAGMAVVEATNRVFVANAGSHDVSVLDAATGAPLNLVSTTAGSCDSCLAVTSRRNGSSRVFIANATDGTIALLDGATGAALGTLPAQ
jgi:YVTN family beta-propeller protein